MAECGIEVPALERKPDLPPSMAEVFLAHRFITSRISITEVIAYCKVTGFEDVEWMLEMVNRLDAFFLGQQQPSKSSEE